MQSKIQMQFDHMYSKINQIEQDIANQLPAQQVQELSQGV